MNEVKFFILKNGIMHTFYPKGNNTTMGENFVINESNIIFKDIGVYPLYESLTDLVENHKEKFINKYAFVDEEGVIHSIGKDGSHSTFLAGLDRRVKIENVVDHGFPPYIAISFIDKDGNNPDEGDFVAWNHVELAKDLDETFALVNS